MRDLCSLLVVSAILLVGCGDEARRPSGGGREEGREALGQPVSSYLPEGHPAATPDLVELGRATYSRQCAACHGADGSGEGDAAYLLYPKPRDFITASYRIVSTWDGVPTDEDLFQTISRGMPGAAMPSWAHLPERTRWGLVHYIKTFAKTPIAVGEPRPVGDPHGAAGVIEVPSEPPATPASMARARELFQAGCAPCHGATARGDGAQEQKDDKGRPTRPRDLTTGVFKGSPTPSDVYRRIVAGLPGSPMPMSDYLYGSDAWDLTHYVLSLSSEEERRRVEMRSLEVVAKAVSQLPRHPDDGVWRDAPKTIMPLMPLWWRPNRPEELTVAALHDGKEIAFLLVWEDSTHDHTAIRPQDFRDAAALEFSLQEDPPFFAMGQAGDFVNIWMWKSERQADLEPAFQELEKIYPNMGIDAYPNLQRSPIEQPMRHALTLESDPTFVTAWGAGNIVADPLRKTSAEDLAAQGFGTLKARPRVEQAVESVGAYSQGSYRVVFRRSLAPKGENSVALRVGEAVPVAFAVWNGSAGDRDGKKSVSIWQSLRVEEQRLAQAR